MKAFHALLFCRNCLEDDDLRIIAGMRRGMKLKAPEGMGTRPTTDRVKESVFNLIQFHFPADCVLDLFAGSGALGIEALSRGAKHCVFLDADRNAAALVRENLHSARFESEATVFEQTAQAYLSQCHQVFDVIFLDPPYNKGFLLPVIQTIHERNLLAEGGIIVVETERGGEIVPDTYYPIKKSVAYGKTVITILQG